MTRPQTLIPWRAYNQHWHIGYGLIDRTGRGIRGGFRDPEPINTVIADSGVIPGGDLFSHSVTKAVSSALGRFTTVFGMGTGGSTPLEPPGNNAYSMHHFLRTGNRIDVLNWPQFAIYYFFAPRNGFYTNFALRMPASDKANEANQLRFLGP